MYTVRDATIEDMMVLSHSIIEPLVFKETMMVGRLMKVIEYNGEVIAGFDIDEASPTICAVGCMFRKGLLKHVRAVKDIIESFIKEKNYEQIYVQCQEGWPVGERFLKFMGFNPEKTVEIDTQSGVQCRVYKRVIE